jgi:hypothetical protein
VYVERHPQPLDAQTDETAMEEDDYSRTDYGPRLYAADAQDRNSVQRENQHFVNGGYAPGPASSDPEAPHGFLRSDERIRDEICERLGLSSEPGAGALQVDVQHGEVTLRGAVEEPARKREIEDICSETRGVVSVRSAVRVRRMRGHSA